jgi:haloalkane dehalogenase
MPQRPSWFDESLLPYDSHWIEINGHQVHYLDVGQGPTLLMLHGNPTWSFLYRRMIAALADRYRCVALDYPGFGLSTARSGFGFTAAEQSVVLQQFVTALDLTDVTPIMQDWGGPIGIGAVTAEPRRYSGLIIGNTWAWPSNLWTRSFSVVMGSRATGPLMSQRLNLFVKDMIPRWMGRVQLTDAEVAMYDGPFPTVESRYPVMVFPREIRTAKPFLTRIESRLASIGHLPTLLFWADKDIAFRDSVRRKWQQALPNRRDHTLVGAGHYWQDDAGDEAARVIGEWWPSR